MSLDRREEIREAARQSFSIFGYKATTMDQVAKAANVGKGTIYNFFQNKEELFQDIIAELLLEMKGKAESVMDDERSLKENVHLALIELLQYRKSHQLTVKLVYEAREIGTAAVKEALQNVEALILEYLKDKIRTAVAEGDIRECDPEITAFMMLKLYTALIIDWEEAHDPLSKEKILHLFDDYVFKGLSPE
ncbi:TetR/AcrR family transcriptional regulator [Halobacillus sp. Nhm2S1]|uniref:TetR/AcrR family transcriptional regulator n=1 Tax=Halobacillus sp. Nhm2S1 TaxID=2866716 RepID=UPI001C733BA2|nr:TetR/AcrR family transcriptional regulator [Halobacillus sp. Nhm2S1]MBX0357264.1 TetR/AcrR family transcriptional regulator [Halobacillus sp. Nhm2S1]